MRPQGASTKKVTTVARLLNRDFRAVIFSVPRSSPVLVFSAPGHFVGST